ncbi:MAG: hypothetical protein RSC43_01215 [Clostridia bacterium]
MLKIYLYESTLERMGGQTFYMYKRMFAHNFIDEWMTPPLTAALTGVDRGKYLGHNVFTVEHLGVIPKDWLSDGFKVLACMQNVNLNDWADTTGETHINELWYIHACLMGDNIFPFMQPILESLPYDVHLYWSTWVNGKLWGNAPLDALIVEPNIHVKTWGEFAEYMMKHLDVFLLDAAEHFEEGEACIR